MTLDCVPQWSQADLDVVSRALTDYEAPIVLESVRSIEDFLVVVDGHVRCRPSATKSIELTTHGEAALHEAVFLNALWELAADVNDGSPAGPDDICQECLDPEDWADDLGSLTNVEAAAGILERLTASGPVKPWKMREDTVRELGKTRTDAIVKRMVYMGLMVLDEHRNIRAAGSVPLGPRHTRRQCILAWWFAPKANPGRVTLDDVSTAIGVDVAALQKIGTRILRVRERMLEEAS